jgi:hypothetical protein
VFEVGKYSNRLCVGTAVMLFDIADCSHEPVMVSKLPYVCHTVSSGMIEDHAVSKFALNLISQSPL